MNLLDGKKFFCDDGRACFTQEAPSAYGGRITTKLTITPESTEGQIVHAPYPCRVSVELLRVLTESGEPTPRSAAQSFRHEASTNLNDVGMTYDLFNRLLDKSPAIALLLSPDSHESDRLRQDRHTLRKCLLGLESDYESSLRKARK